MKLPQIVPSKTGWRRIRSCSPRKKKPPALETRWPSSDAGSRWS